MIIVRHTFSVTARNGVMLPQVAVMITRWGVKMLMDTIMMMIMIMRMLAAVVGLGSWDGHGRKRMAADAGSTAGMAVGFATTATAAGNAPDPVGLAAGVERRLAALQVVHLG